MKARGIRLHHYLDDLLLSQDRKQLLEHRAQVISTLQEFGWLLNIEQSHLEPCRPSCFLGAQFNMVRGTISLHEEKVSVVITCGTLFITSPCLAVSEDCRHHDSHGEMDALENATFPERLPPTMEARQQGPAYLLNAIHERMPTLVASAEESPQLSLDCTHFMGHNNHRCQQYRLGHSLSIRDSMGQMGLPCSWDSLKHSGVTGVPGITGLPSSNIGVSSDAQIRQHNSNGLHDEAGRILPLIPVTGSRGEYDRGSEEPVQLVSKICSRSPECSSRFPLLSLAGQQRLGSPQGSLQVGTDPGFHFGGRPLCITMQQQTSKILLEIQRSPGLRGGCSHRALEILHDLCLSSGSDYSPVPVESQDRRGGCSGDNPMLAQQTVVSSINAIQFLGSDPPASQTRLTVSGHCPTSMLGSPALEGLVLKRGRLEALGCPEEAIPTLLNASRKNTNRVYERIWSKFADHISSRASSYSAPTVQDVLGFFQSGLDLALSVSFLRMHVSAISAFT